MYKKLFLLSFILFFGICQAQNSDINLELEQKAEEVTNKWNDLQNSYQRRADIVAPLVAILKDILSEEANLLTDLTLARSEAVKMTLNIDSLTENDINTFQKLQGDLTTCFAKVIVESDNYPQAKANEYCEALVHSVAGMENRIYAQSIEYNQAAEAYNQLAENIGIATKPRLKIVDEETESANDIF